MTKDELLRRCRQRGIGIILVVGAFLVAMAMIMAHATEVGWSRFKGKVKGINGKTAMLTIQNAEGDLIILKVDQDVELLRGKEKAKLTELAIDEKVTVLYLPKAPLPKEDEPPPGGVYK